MVAEKSRSAGFFTSSFFDLFLSRRFAQQGFGQPCIYKPRTK
jgi:hypothetical protein